MNPISLRPILLLTTILLLVAQGTPAATPQPGNAPDADARANTARTGVYDAPIPDAPWETAWTTPLGEHVTTTPIVAGDVIIVATLAKGISAIDIATGEVRWQV